MQSNEEESGHIDMNIVETCLYKSLLLFAYARCAMTSTVHHYRDADVTIHAYRAEENDPDDVESPEDSEVAEETDSECEDNVSFPPEISDVAKWHLKVAQPEENEELDEALVEEGKSQWETQFESEEAAAEAYESRQGGRI